MTTKNAKKVQEQEAKKAAFRELVTQVDAGLKAEQAAGKAGKYTMQLQRVAQTPALQGLRRYSVLNQALILAQCPNATETYGYVGWQERGYQVRKGEKAIYIVAPHERRQGESEAGEEGSRPGFHRTRVFDRSQVQPIIDAPQQQPYDVDAADEEDMKLYGTAAPRAGDEEEAADEPGTSQEEGEKAEPQAD